MTRFIAEISSNHNGNKERCLDLIRAAAHCGCWGVKFQLFRIEKLFAPEILQVSEMHRLRRRWELPIHFLPELAACAHAEGLAFGCTPFDLGAVDILQPHVDFLKVASYELPWLGLIQKCGESGLPLMMSCGMADEQEVAQAVETAKQSGVSDLTVFHCISNYPVVADRCNLAAIGTLQSLLETKFPGAQTGWSDHSVNPGVVSRAIHHWQCDAVEFHFDLEGQGEEFSAGHCWLPQQIQPLIAGQKHDSNPHCDGLPALKPTSSEMAERKWRADPSDGLRPTISVRQSWPQHEPEYLTESKVLFVAGGPGLGHMVRLTALAEQMRNDFGIKPVFMTHQSPGAEKVIARHGFFTKPETMSIEMLNPSVVVFDFKEPCVSLVRQCQAAGVPTVAIDRPDCTGADLVVVPSMGWLNETNQGHHTGGSQYQLLRSDVVRLRPSSVPPCGPGIMVSFGAEDPNLLTEKTAAALTRLPLDTPVRFIIGPDFLKHRPTWPPPWAQHPGFQLMETHEPLETLLPGTGLLITALGVTIAEAQVLGVAVAVMTNYPSDAESIDRLVSAEAAFNLGYHADLSEKELADTLTTLWAHKKKREILATNGLQITDGNGARRASLLMAKYFDSKPLGEERPC